MLLVVIVDVVILGVPFFMLSVITLNVVMLSVMAPIMCHNRCLLKFEKERFSIILVITLCNMSDNALDFLVNQASLVRHT